MNEIVILLITNILSPIITGYVTYRQTKKRYETEVDSDLIDNLTKSLNFYQTIVEDNQAKLMDLLKQNKELEQKIDDLKKEVALLYQYSCIKEDCTVRVPSTCMLKNRLDEIYGEADE